MTRFLLVFIAFTLTACTEVRREVVSDHSSRSVIYGWVDISEVRGNRMANLTIRQHQPATEFPFLHPYFEKFAGGYIFAVVAVPNGTFKLDKMVLQSCLGILCDNTFNEYDFGLQGSGLGTITVRKPGVYYIGSFKLRRIRSGLFSPRSFSFQKAPRSPSRKSMLGFLIKNAQSKHAIYNQRIRNEFNRF